MYVTLVHTKTVPTNPLNPKPNENNRTQFAHRQ